MAYMYYVDENGKVTTNKNTNKNKNTNTSKKKKNQLEQIYYNVDENGKVTTNNIEDIAPVKKTTSKSNSKKKNKWYEGYLQLGDALSDGYDFGDITKTYVATHSDIAENLTAGVIGMGEKIVDAGAYVAGGVGGLFGADDFKKKTEKFIEKDLYDEKKVAEKLVSVGVSPLNVTQPLIWADRLLNGGKEDNSIYGDKADSLIQSGGQLLATAGLQYLGVPWYLTTGTTSFGGQAETALNEGATYEQAGGSALISAGAEILFEKLGGGIKFGGGKATSVLQKLAEKGKLGGKTLQLMQKLDGNTTDDLLLRPLTEKISNKLLKKAVNLGLDAGGEGIEELLTSMASRAGTGLYKEESLEELLWSEEAVDEYIDSLFGGFLMGGSSGVVKSFTKSNLTENEQKVVDKEVENRISEAEKKGKTIWAKDREEIYNKVLNDLSKGGISTDTIESVLGDKTYETYKTMEEQENALKEEIESLENTPKEQFTVKQDERLKELREELAKIDKTQIKEQLSNEVSELVKDSRLVESYNEKARRSQAFTADLTKYDVKQQETVKRAIESGILNNTNRTHELVDLIAKISADKGVLFDFTNNEKLKESGFAVEGKTVNGYVTEDGNIGINIESSKSLNRIVGHEITHVLEGTELYTELQKAVKQYATTKGEYDTRIQEMTKLYTDKDGKLRKGANIENEVTADLVGDYLFADDDFINNLSTEQPNIFKKIYDEIKYLCKVATAGSKEARQLEKLKRTFEKVYKQTSSTNSDTKNSLSDSVNNNIKVEVNDFRDGETFATMSYTQDGKTVGTIEYSEYDGQPSIKMIEVEPEYRRKGIATKLLQELQKKYPDVEIDYGMTTPDGSKLLESITYDVTDEAVVADKQKLQNLQTELNDLQERLDVLYDTENLTAEQEAELQKLGDRWNEVYDDIRKLESTLKGKKATKTFVKTDTDKGSSLRDVDPKRISTNESDVSYSLSYNSEIAKGQTDYVLNKKSYVTESELAEAQKVTNAMVDVMTKYSSILPEDKIGKVLTKNGSYDRSVENTTICVRTLAYNEFVDKVQEEIGRPLTQMESFLVSQKLYDIATEPQCMYCYVSLDRKAFNDMLLRYMNDRDTVIDKYNKSDKSDKAVKELYQEFLNGRKDTKPMQQRFNKWISDVDNGVQLLSLADIATEERQSEIKAKGGDLAQQLADARKYAQGASWSKIQKNYVAYRDEILKLGDRVVKNLNEHYGLRWYSFSDYSPAFIVENMQQITDASIRGLKGLSYTKDTDFAKVFAPSEMNINISVFVGMDENGNFYIDEKQSADFEEAKKLREKYPNVGIVATVTNDEALRWAGEQEWSDVIIPFHIVRTGTNVAEYYKWLNYTAESSDTISDKNIWDAYVDSLNIKSENARRKVSKNVYPNEHNNDKDTYLKLCESRGLSPRFVRFAKEDWYMKLVNETKLPAKESKPLKPKYDLESAKESFNKFVQKGGYEGGWYKEGVDVDAEAKTVASDVLAGKQANEVDYGRQDNFNPEELIVGRKTNRTHGGVSNVALEKQIAPTATANVRFSLSNISEDERFAHIKTAQEYFGTTQNWNEVGYITLDGNKLDFSGRHEGGLGGSRDVDHRDISDALGDNYGGDDFSGSLVQFMSEGNIRIMPESNGINLSVMPTKEQMKALDDFISRNNGEVILDIDDLNGKTVFSKEYPSGTFAEKIFKDIETHFKSNGDNYISPYSQFRLSLSEQKQNIAPYGKYDIYGKDVALETPVQEVAPVQEPVSKMETTTEDYAPLQEEQANESDVEQSFTSIESEDTEKAVESYDTEKVVESYMDDAPVEESIEKILYSLEETKNKELSDIDTKVEEAENAEEPELTVNESYNARLENYNNAIEGYKTARTEIETAFDDAIEKKSKEYEALKRKDTKKASDILMQIENLKLRKANNLSNIDSRIDKTQTSVDNMIKNADSIKQGMYGRRRKALHTNIMNGIKETFATKGFDFDKVLKKAKNKSTFASVDNTPQRFMEKTLGYQEGQALADLTVNKVAQNETEGIKWVNENVSLLKQISKEYGIKPRSKESASAQMYAEGFYADENGDLVAYGDKELKEDFGDPRVIENIKKLAKDARIRSIYDETLDQINKSRTRNAYPEIPKRDNYFLHFIEMDDAFSRLGIPFNPNDIRAKDLPTDINGVTADLKPGQPYFASAMQRKGYKTTYDLLGGVEKYLNSAKNQIYHIDDIQTLRATRNYIADMFGQAKGLEDLDTMTEAEANERIEQVFGSHLSNFAKFLHEEANVIAGKTALIDRGLEGIIGRRGISFLNTLNGQVGSNMVGFNVSSSLTNFISVMQSMAKSSKIDTLKAFTQTASNKIGSMFGRTDGFADTNPAIIRRKGIDTFARKPFEKISDSGYVLMSAIDDISTEIIVRTKFNELTRKGMSEEQAHIESDKWAHRILGDRSLGQQPLLYNSKMLGLVTKFQLEVRNQLDSQFYDTIQEAKVSTEEIDNAVARNAVKSAKIGSTLVQLAVLQHVFGKAFESVAGYNPAFDIIEVLMTAFGFDDEEDSEDTPLDNIEQGFLALLEDLPYSSVLTGGRIPISSALPITELVKGEDSYGQKKSRVETLKEVAPYYLLPTGYGQIKKTKQGLNMFSDKHPVSGSYTDSGNLRFPVEDTTKNRIQAGLFGQWANENARYYFDNDIAPLNEKQTKEYIDVDMPIKDYWKYREGLKGLKKLNEKGDYIGGLDLPIDKKNILINNVANRKDPIDFTGYEDYSNFQEFDFANRYPEKYQVLQEQGISVKDYKENHEKTAFIYTDAYSWASNNNEKYLVSKAVTDDVSKYKQYTSDISKIKSDKDSNGKTISGSRKEKVIDYINNLDADYGQRIILFKSIYDKDDTYNYDIVDYLNSRDDITFDEMNTILKELGFTVTADGTIYWD